MLGELTALALAVLVAADVVDTVIKPTHEYEMNEVRLAAWLRACHLSRSPPDSHFLSPSPPADKQVVKLGFITVLRTGLAYFLAKEIKEQEEVHQTREIIRTKSSLGLSLDRHNSGGLGHLSSHNSGVGLAKPSPPNTPGGPGKKEN